MQSLDRLREHWARMLRVLQRHDIQQRQEQTQPNGIVRTPSDPDQALTQQRRQREEWLATQKPARIVRPQISPPHAVQGRQHEEEQRRAQKQQRQRQQHGPQGYGRG